jgi:hypothetical protein
MIIPVDNIRDINNALDIDRVQNKNFRSTTVTFWIINNTAIPAMTKLIISLWFIFVSPCFTSFYHLMNNFIRIDFADSDLFFLLKSINFLYSYNGRSIIQADRQRRVFSVVGEASSRKRRRAEHGFCVV